MGRHLSFLLFISILHSLAPSWSIPFSFFPLSSTQTHLHIMSDDEGASNSKDAATL